MSVDKIIEYINGLRDEKIASRTLCDELARVLEDWSKMSPSGQDDWVFRRRDVLTKYQKLTNTTKTGE